MVLHLAGALLFPGCEKYEKHPVPGVPVNFVINVTTDPEFIRLGATGNSQGIQASSLGLAYLGYDNNGVMVYNAGNNEFYAFDMTCPYEMPARSIGVETETSSGMAVCPECGTTYILPAEGQPSSDGPGGWPLLKYKAYYYPSTGDLQVSN